MTDLNLSKPASTPAPATPLRMLAPAPFIMDMMPSFLRICAPQSKEFLYLTAAPEVIIILLIVSMGYDMRPEVIVTAQPRMKEAPTPASAPSRMVFTYTSTSPLNFLAPSLPLASFANL